MRPTAREFDRPRGARQGTLSSFATSSADDTHPPVCVNSSVYARLNVRGENGRGGRAVVAAPTHTGVLAWPSFCLDMQLASLPPYQKRINGQKKAEDTRTGCYIDSEVARAIELHVRARVCVCVVCVHVAQSAKKTPLTNPVVVGGGE